VESENYCIGDVVRIRRKMLGMSQKKLCEDLCDERTLSRLENNKSKPQREVVRCLFDRLNLSTELCRTELVTESKEAIEKYKELRKQNNNRNYEAVEQLVAELKKLINMEIPSNEQALMRNNVFNKYNQSKITKREYIDNMKNTLGITVPYKAAIELKERYLTNEEIACLQNIALKSGWNFIEMGECVSALITLCESPKYPANYIRVYEFIMTAVSGYLGDKGDFNYSNKINRKIIKMSLKYRRIKAIDNAMYGIIWNKCVEHKNYVPSEQLDTCIKISSLSKKKFQQRFYEVKKEQILTNF